VSESLELAIDTASDIASVALTREGVLAAELTWRAGRAHSSQLLPAIDALLARQGASKDALSAVFVCTGPGSYAGVRSGLSVAKGLAFALEVPIVGVCRLEAEAYAYAAVGGPVAALHRAGRSELAWAVYQGPDWRETVAPGLATAEALLESLPDRALVTGEVDDALAGQLTARGHRVARGAAALRRAALVAGRTRG
jgi:tRNA threonylcarbamoyladenosine biosynthesis protein TsaB